MNLKNLYEKVNIRQKIDERTFLSFFNESVEELYIMFGAKYVTKIEKDKKLAETEKDESCEKETVIVGCHWLLGVVCYTVLAWQLMTDMSHW